MVLKHVSSGNANHHDLPQPFSPSLLLSQSLSPSSSGLLAPSIARSWPCNLTFFHSTGTVSPGGPVPSCFWCVSHSPICCSSSRSETGSLPPIRNPRRTRAGLPTHRTARRPLTFTLSLHFPSRYGPLPLLIESGDSLWGLPGQRKSRPRQSCGYRPAALPFCVPSSDLPAAPRHSLLLRVAGFLLAATLAIFTFFCTIVQPDLILFSGDAFVTFFLSTLFSKPCVRPRWVVEVPFFCWSKTVLTTTQRPDDNASEHYPTSRITDAGRQIKKSKNLKLFKRRNH